MAQAKAKADMEDKENATAAQGKAEDLQKEVSTASDCCLGAHTACAEYTTAAGHDFRTVPFATWQHCNHWSFLGFRAQ